MYFILLKTEVFSSTTCANKTGVHFFHVIYVVSLSCGDFSTFISAGAENSYTSLTAGGTT
jgi:hypothetical protein